MVALPMPIRPCPTCANSTPRWLERTVPSAFVNYYRCDKCGNEQRTIDQILLAKKIKNRAAFQRAADVLKEAAARVGRAVV